MVILRIRQAQCALADGRLDEAYEMARHDDVREHHRGQRLISRLVEAFIKRGESHLASERYELARLDCDKALHLGGRQLRISQLRAEATAAIIAHEGDKCRHHQLLDAARRQIDCGHLSIGEQILNKIEAPNKTASKAMDDIATRRAVAEGAMATAREALSRNAYDAAIKALLEAKQVHASNQKLVDLTAQLSAQVVGRVRQELNRGQMDLAESLLERLIPLDGDNIEVRELDQIVDQCRLAARCIERGEFHQAGHLLKAFCDDLPGADWLKAAIQHVEQVATSIDAVRACPLGRLIKSGTAMMTTPAPGSEQPNSVRGSSGRIRCDTPNGANDLPARFLLRIDGAGSFLVMRQPVITIGPVSSSRRPDVGLLAQAGLPMVMIERIDDDYFLRSDTPVQINDQSATKKLLSNGDRIALGPRCWMKYALPNVASTSAVMDLAGAKLPHADTRKVILLDESLIVGPGPSAHVRADELDEPVILHTRNGRLHYRIGAPPQPQRDDRSLDDAPPIALGQAVRIGPLSMILTEAPQ